MWIPSVLLLDDQMNYFKPSCYATLISEQFLLTMARCKYVTTNIQIQYGLLHADLFSKFEFHINPSEPEGLALVKLPRKPRQFNQVINCLWTEEDTPVQFEVQIKHAYSQTTEMYFRAEYTPTKPIKLVNINRCYHVSSMIMSSAPGDAVVLKRDNETLPRVVGMTTRGFGGCYDQTAESVAETLDWIEGIVWGKL
ncbi:hypothetical protein pipiens_006191 [Culex pipiens pipiens]|uniref:Peptidase S1 domain-containing protein n=1 Tax=Culex pipiens pipiens TaxID=38569 RepID=A0ABD1DRG8_CULPP